MGPLEDALAEQLRRSESMARSAKQSFKSTTDRADNEDDKPGESLEGAASDR